MARSSFAAILGLALAVAIACFAGLGPALATATGACALTTPLTITDTQDGFAGPMGTIWTIMPDCSFSVARKMGESVGQPERQGRLTPAQQTRLNELLTQAEIANLPENIGENVPVNARQITLSYGGKTSTLRLPGGLEDLRALQSRLADDSGRRLVTLADGVSRLMSE